MMIRFKNGSLKRLRKSALDEALCRRVLERIQLSSPHLIFDDWEIRDNDKKSESGAFEQSGRRKIRCRVMMNAKLNITSLCQRHAGDVHSEEDKQFLKHLSIEAAKTLSSEASDASLSNFGAQSVAGFIMQRFELDDSPLPLIQFLRNIGHQTYENQRIPYGVVIRPDQTSPRACKLIDAVGNKRFQHLTDGFSTAFILDRAGNILGIESLALSDGKGEAARRRPHWFSNLSELASKKSGIGIGLNRSGDILISINGRLAFSQRSGVWKRWDHSEIIKLLKSLPKFEGKPYDFTDVLTYIYQVALDLSFRRSGGLFVMLETTTNKGELLSLKEQAGSLYKSPADQALDRCLMKKRIHYQDRRLMADIASLDGAIVIDRNGNLISYGQVLKVPSKGSAGEQGARTRAARGGSRYGLSIKISSDGDISFYSNCNKEFQI